ncbi:hypothetical protein GF357_01580 [Candidatus Dojkabacteria bacterium]|nr:hypothetical protein [Candidatus Dojkabacteria bacterium]
MSNDLKVLEIDFEEVSKKLASLKLGSLLIGSANSPKADLQVNLMKEASDNGASCIIFEESPRNSFYKEISKKYPELEAHLLELSNPHFVLNPLEGHVNNSDQINSLILALRRAYEAFYRKKDTLSQHFRHLILKAYDELKSIEGLDLIKLLESISDEEHLRRIAKRDKSLNNILSQVIEGYSDKWSKFLKFIKALLEDDSVKAIFDTSKKKTDRFSYESIQGKNLIFNIKSGRRKNFICEFVFSLFVQQIVNNVAEVNYSKQVISQRKDVHLIFSEDVVDYLDPQWKYFWGEARLAGIRPNVAISAPNVIKDDVKNLLFGNFASIVAFPKTSFARSIIENEMGVPAEHLVDPAAFSKWGILKIGKFESENNPGIYKFKLI